VRLGLPQHPAVVGPQRRGAVPQGLIELRPAVALRPGLQQRVGGGQRDLLEVGTAACTLACICTVRTGLAGSMVTRPTVARLLIAARTMFWSVPPAVLGRPAM
jgi:hypothetical protein